MIGSEKALLAYELTYIEPEYEVIHSQELADEARSNYTNGKRFMYDYVPHLKTILIARATDRIINEIISVARRSMKGLLLFYKPYVAGARDSEKTFNPGITEVKMVVNGIPNKVYSQGMNIRDMWEEVFWRFDEENSAIN